MSFLNQLANNVVPTGVGLAILLELVLKGIAVVTVAVCLAGLFRKSSAAVRHFVWLLAVITVVAAPAVSRLMPDSAWSRFATAPLAIRWQPGVVDGMSDSRGSTDIDSVETRAVLPAQAQHLATHPITAQEKRALTDAIALKESVQTIEPVSSSTDVAAFEPVGTTIDLRKWVVLAFTCWISVATVIVGLAFSGRLLFWRRQRSFREVTNPEMLKLVQSICEGLGIRRSVKILEGHADSVL